MSLLDVNALVALAWDTHVHHAAMRGWFTTNSASGWATCPPTESGFVRVSSNPKVLPHPVGVATAVEVLGLLRRTPSHSFVADDVSMTDADVPPAHGYRQVSDVHLLTIARRHGLRLLTFDAALARSAAGDAELLAY